MKPLPKSGLDTAAKDETEADDVPDWRLGDAVEQVALLLCVYVFSIGPMYWTWVQAKFLRGNYAVALFYEPLWIIAGLIPPLGRWLNWYVKWWNL